MRDERRFAKVCAGLAGRVTWELERLCTITSTHVVAQRLLRQSRDVTRHAPKSRRARRMQCQANQFPYSTRAGLLVQEHRRRHGRMLAQRAAATARAQERKQKRNVAHCHRLQTYAGRKHRVYAFARACARAPCNIVARPAHPPCTPFLYLGAPPCIMAWFCSAKRWPRRSLVLRNLSTQRLTHCSSLVEMAFEVKSLTQSSKHLRAGQNARRADRVGAGTDLWTRFEYICAARKKGRVSRESCGPHRPAR